MIDMYPPRCSRCNGSGFCASAGENTSMSCPACGPKVYLVTKDGGAVSVPVEIKVSKPKKGHFRRTFGESGKNHWQKNRR